MNIAETQSSSSCQTSCMECCEWTPHIDDAISEEITQAVKSGKLTKSPDTCSKWLCNYGTCPTDTLMSSHTRTNPNLTNKMTDQTNQSTAAAETPGSITSDKFISAMQAANVVAIGSSDGMSMETATEVVGGLARLSDHFDKLIQKQHPDFGRGNVNVEQPHVRHSYAETPFTYLVTGRGTEGKFFYVRCLNVSGENPNQFFSSNPDAPNYCDGCELMEVGQNVEILLPNANMQSPMACSQPLCPKCDRSNNMVWHGSEWVCHSTHILETT